MPIALFVGIPLVAVCYLLVNIAFFAVLSYEDILGAEAVALVSHAIKIIMTNQQLLQEYIIRKEGECPTQYTVVQTCCG